MQSTRRPLRLGEHAAKIVPDSGSSSSLGGRGGADHRGQEEGRLEACSIRFGRRGRDFGVEEASWLAGKRRTHHRSGGGVGGRIGTSFTGEGHKDFVDTLMGSVSRGVGAGPGQEIRWLQSARSIIVSSWPAMQVERRAPGSRSLEAAVVEQ